MMEVLTEKEQTCYHCGDQCQQEAVSFDDKSFCCYGCKAVYELIESSDLKQYYQNGDLRAGKALDQLAAERKFAFLDLEEVSSGLIRYQDEQKALVRFYIPGIHCSSCIYLLEHLPRLRPAVLRAEVNFVRKEITLTYDHHHITLKELAVLLSGLGYAPSINLDSLDASKKRIRASSIGMKIAVAGFCFGNSMLMSLPEYLDAGFQLEEGFRQLFGWLNLLMALPVVFYAAQDYFRSSWKGLSHGYLNIDVPISLGIITLFSRSVYEIVTVTGPGYVDSLNGLIFFLLLGKWYQSKTYQALSFDRDYASYFPISVTKLTEDGEETVMLKDLRAGDRVVIHSQELIPADGLIAGGTGNLDYSFVTGESEPVDRGVGDLVYAGGRQTGGPLTITLKSEVNNSELTQLWNSQSQKDKNHYDLLIDRVSKYFTIIILLLALGTAAYWGAVDPAKVWNAVTAVLIIACPCALALTLPFAFGHAMRLLGARGVYLRHSNVIEEISRVRQIIFDKTGTLTRNDPRKISFCGPQLTDHECALVKTLASNSAHPLSKLIAAHFGEGVRKLPISDFSEVIGQGVEARVGADQLKMGAAEYLGVSAATTQQESRVYLAINSEHRGYFSIKTGYRSGIFDMLDRLKQQFDLHLLSGDNDKEWEMLKPYFTRLGFNQRPVQKLEYVQAIDGRKLMIGDGLNDAGALKAANVGFSICEDVHQFSPACDAMVEASAIRLLPGVLAFAKKVVTVIIVAFVISFVYNIAGLSFAVSGKLTPIISAILMPASSVTVVGFITLAVSLYGRKFLKRDGY